MSGEPHEIAPGAQPEAADEAGWAEVRARWDDEEAHWAFVVKCAERGFDGLSEAGRRYRTALDDQPGDPAALRWRDEVLRRATALAFAQLPRTAPSRLAAAPGLRRLVVALLVLAMVAAVAFVLLRAPGIAR
jgi:hypothetical protein